MHHAQVLSQLFAACGASPRGCFWYLCAAGGQHLSTALVLLSLVALAPLAHASPGDSSWIPGIYDAADCDDAIWILTDPSTTASCAPTDARFFPIVARQVSLASSGSFRPARLARFISALRLTHSAPGQVFAVPTTRTANARSALLNEEPLSVRRSIRVKTLLRVLGGNNA